MSPTLTEMKEYLKSKNGKISFADFLEVMHTHSLKENPSKDIDAAFMASNPNKSRTISEKQLRHILKNTGEKLSTKEGYFGRENSRNYNSHDLFIY